VGSIIVSLYHPPKGYSSVSFSRAIELGFPLNVDLSELVGSPFDKKFLLAPFYSMDGINEHGLAVAIAGVRHVVHSKDNNGKRTFVSYLVRKLLDQTRTTEEAVKLAESCVPFLLDKDSLDAHLHIADASGRSVTLEYDKDQWLKVYGKGSWQALANKPVFEVPEATRREKCWRYRTMAETLEKTSGRVDWKAGLKILRDVHQKGTTWSALYSPSSKDIYFSVYQTWDKIYHLKAF
jgi:hypothetical protein